MLFNSFEFLIFFPIVVLLYFVMPTKIKNYWLLIASYYFYMCWNAKYALLMLFSTIVTFLSGLLLEKVKQSKFEEIKKTKYKKLVVALSIVLNLAVLFYFKYVNFAFDTLETLFGYINIELNVPTFDIILPVGISFYTFQALSYTMDVYRDDIYAEKNFFRYALFVSFFPQLVAGPIERSKNLLKQLATPQKFNFEKARDGFLLMIWGFFLKVVLADRIALFVDAVYGNYTEYTGWYIVVATVLLAVQIYCDFYGYSVIAMGASEILGIKLMENFESPYMALSVAEFWRRWHISLTSWFKDYLYIPLGGSRKGKFRKYLNKFIVFLVSGLWHGANMSFVVWGGLNGLYQIIGEVLQPVRDKAVKILCLHRESIGHKALKWLVTFVLVDFTWIFFRANGFREALEIIKCMFAGNNPWILLDGSLYNIITDIEANTIAMDSKNFWLMIICILILIFADICKYKGIKIREIIAKQDLWCRYLVMIVAICAILVFGIWGSGYDSAGFIYFQF